ncbi:MAG: hypothetical protein SHS37scaffold296_23 [Burkholderiales phage 68_11]|jgi:hypothetical protein|nr:MAG: hypothetical protein SHS37scaffold296_23 [Burkholderiales phage 68_11]
MSATPESEIRRPGVVELAAKIKRENPALSDREAAIRAKHQYTTPEKVAYVKGQGQTRQHQCHWPGCERQVPPAMWGCRPHWYTLPAELRNRIWSTFRPGQEVKGTPSTAYVEAARAVQEWIAQHQAAHAVPQRSLL